MGYTFTMIKPKVVESNQIGAVLQRMESAGFQVVAMKKTRLSVTEAALFYGEHEGKPFFEPLIEFMSSAPIVAIILKRDGDTIADFRKLIGNTDPNLAEEGTIRKEFATSKTYNAVHGSDSEASFEREAKFFFSTRDIYM